MSLKLKCRENFLTSQTGSKSNLDLHTDRHKKKKHFSLSFFRNRETLYSGHVRTKLLRDSKPEVSEVSKHSEQFTPKLTIDRETAGRHFGNTACPAATLIMTTIMYYDNNLSITKVYCILWLISKTVTGT